MLGILRPVNLFLLFLTQFSLWFRLSLPLNSPERYHESILHFILLSFSACCIAAGGYVINDIFDRNADILNKPDKTYIDISISKEKAYILYLTLTFVGILSSILIKSIPIIIIVIFATLILYAYSALLKRTIFWGNLTVALLAAVALAEIFILFKPFDLLNFKIFISYGFFAFFSTLMREIVKDLEDKEGDMKISAFTLALAYPLSTVKNILYFTNSILIVTLCAALYLMADRLSLISILYFTLLIVAAALLFYYIHKKCVTKKDLGNFSFVLKIYMLLGLIWLWI